LIKQRDGVLAAKDQIIRHNLHLTAENKRLKFSQSLTKDDTMLQAERARLEAKFQPRLKMLKSDLMEAHRQLQEARKAGADQESMLQNSFDQLDDQHKVIGKYQQQIQLQRMDVKVSENAKMKMENDIKENAAELAYLRSEKARLDQIGIDHRDLFFFFSSGFLLLLTRELT
jgi:hypothetical protein